MITIFTTIMQPLLRCRRWALWPALAVLTGCTNALVVDADFPKPITAPIDITMAVVYDEQMTKFVYEEQSKSRDRWQIGVGEAHEHLFKEVFEPLFRDSISLKTVEEAKNYPQIDLLLIPKINEFQYSSPRETRINIYEVWIKYNMQVYNPDGELVADWIMSAYGKTPSAFLQSKEEAMHQAVVVALRDLGASLTTGFARVPEIRSWLEEHQASASTTAADTGQ
ncbi:hypothetical protein [Halioxenophilus sp. WMMB6]|uniref:hypothetical protein n=1 Tax=Halioxenophilus sp. WMMB6 TaxID=3073815 RepID=UPI00295ECE76|nr:hypothetical protein [Halioxenophilus sp. WMMB6]